MKTSLDLDELEKQANEIKAELDALDPESDEVGTLQLRLDALNADIRHAKTPEPHERKMRFATDEGDEPISGKGLITYADSRKLLESLNENRQFSALDMGRALLHSRGGELPNDYLNRLQNLAQKRTMMTTGEGTGAELVDTVMYHELWQDIHARTLLAQQLKRVIMSAGTMELSEMGNGVFYKPAGEAQAVTATDLVTGKRTLKAYTLKAQVDISDEEDDDAVIAMIPEIRATLIRNAASVIDSVLLNGDTTGASANINKYGAAVVGTEAYLLGFDGIIHYCLNEVPGQKSSLTTLEDTDFLTLIALLGKYADDPKRCLFVLDRNVKNKALDITEFKTLDMIGEKATILIGQIAQAFGVPAILSSQIEKSDANGRVDGANSANNTLGRMLLLNRDAWAFGIRRAVRVRTERSEAKSMTSLVATFRIALQAFGDRADAKYCHTALGYNITI